MRGKTSTN